MKTLSKRPRDRGGSILILTLWVVLVLSLLIGSFAFDMHVEAAITSTARKRLKADYLARSGVDWARSVMTRSRTVAEDTEAELDEDYVASALNVKNGAGVQGLMLTLGEGTLTIDIVPEKSRRNVNKLTDEDWEEILDQCGVPQDQWAEMIDCFNDWVDENDEHAINGAESDDSFYVDAGYKVKNGKLDSIDELLLIKGFSEQIVYGGPAEDPEMPPYTGMAHLLTVWDDGRINVNTASPEVLMTLGMDDTTIEEILERRLGEDGEPNTRDDGLKPEDLAALGLSGDRTLTTSDLRYVRVRSIGEVHGVKSGVWCVLYLDDRSIAHIVQWREEPVL